MTLVLSLFPGIGLLDRAFEEEGFCVVRGPDLLWGGDIHRFHPPAGKFDGVIGGPPCQAFSPLSNLVRARGYEPKFGNLIPQFERCVSEAEPDWFVMEEVPQAPRACVYRYSVSDFTLCNSALDAGDGFGEEQERVRRFTFGVRDLPACDLTSHIRLAALRLPRATTVTQASVDNSPERKQRVQAVLSDARAVPVALGGSRKRKATVSNRQGVNHQGKGERFSIAESCRLQGLPETFLVDAPFTMTGRRKAIANGVPLPMGRAIARAVKQALGLTTMEASA
jgi:DNA (cytosine-5)-methyltransferase 1